MNPYTQMFVTFEVAVKAQHQLITGNTSESTANIALHAFEQAVHCWQATPENMQAQYLWLHASLISWNRNKNRIITIN